jgi:hypothetical protein
MPSTLQYCAKKAWTDRNTRPLGCLLNFPSALLLPFCWTSTEASAALECSSCKYAGTIWDAKAALLTWQSLSLRPVPAICTQAVSTWPAGR